METPGKRNSIAKRLAELKTELEQQRRKQTELEGELKAISKQLLEYNAYNVTQAEEIATQKEIMIEETEKSIQRQVEYIKELMKEGRNNE